MKVDWLTVGLALLSLGLALSLIMAADAIGQLVIAYIRRKGVERELANLVRRWRG